MSRKALGCLLGACVLWLIAVPAFATDTVYYFMTDALHSTVVVTDQNRNIVEETHYGPYGLVLNRQLRDGPGYAGHTEDPATGLVYMQQRYYDPQAGRFISTDPVPVSGGAINRYAYASDNPYRYTDPDGASPQGAWPLSTPCRPGPYCGHAGAQGMMTFTGNVEDVDNRSGLDGSGASGLASGGAQNNTALQAQTGQKQCSTQCQKSHVERADAAIRKYHIKGSGYSLQYNPDQVADGLTSVTGIVSLGPSAFKSESWLGSNLGHEIEVHWDLQMQPYGGWKTYGEIYFREIEAYKYNIRNFQRFGNSPEEQAEIYNRLHYAEEQYEYYKDKDIF